MYFDSIARIIAERTGCGISAVKPESTFTELGIDSLDTVELLMKPPRLPGAHQHCGTAAGKSLGAHRLFEPDWVCGCLQPFRLTGGRNRRSS